MAAETPFASIWPRFPASTPGMRIGLLGGSFNPAHDGHRQISLEALARLDLDRIWWLVTPGNPLKDHGELKPLDERLRQAAELAAHPHIDVTGVEAALGSRYTALTLRHIRKRHRGVHFVWLMGADNLAQFHRWRDWRRIVATMPVAVLDRPGWRLEGLAAPAAIAYAHARLPEAKARDLAVARPPAWTFLSVPLSPLSSTALRAKSRLKPPVRSLLSSAEPVMSIAGSLEIDGASVRLSPRDPAFVADPYATYHRIRAVAPRFYWHDYGFWCFAAHADVSNLLRDRRFGRQMLHVASRAELGWPEPDPRLAAFHTVESHSLLELEPPAHTRLRGLVTRAFVSRQIERLRPRMAALSHALIDDFVANGAVDLLPAFAEPIPVTVIAELLGIETAMTNQLLSWSHALVAMYQFRRSAAEEEAAVRAAIAFTDYLRAVITGRRARPQDALLDHLIAAESEAGKLTEDEIISTAILLLNAGHEATVHAIGNGVKSLLEAGLGAPDLSRPDAMPGIVEEVMRHDPPLHMFTRYALEDIDLDGIACKRGDQIGLLLGAANRDPARFAEPDRFDPARSPNPHLALGAGIHFCLGAPLARLELEVALPILFQRLPRLALAEAPRYRDTYHFHGLERLRLTW